MERCKWCMKTTKEKKIGLVNAANFQIFSNNFIYGTEIFTYTSSKYIPHRQLIKFFF